MVLNILIMVLILKKGSMQQQNESVAVRLLTQL
jgi:hypothetical protein